MVIVDVRCCDTTLHGLGAATLKALSPSDALCVAHAIIYFAGGSTEIRLTCSATDVVKSSRTLRSRMLAVVDGTSTLKTGGLCYKAQHK